MLFQYMAWCFSDFLNEGAQFLSGNKVKGQLNNLAAWISCDWIGRLCTDFYTPTVTRHRIEGEVVLTDQILRW